jgi:HSP20 family molecular chaperone IbpA
MNTLNGGTTEPMVRLKQFSSHRQITVRVPGVSFENMKMEINNNQLMVYYLTGIVSQEKEVQFPRILYNKSIPYFVDAKNITAQEEGDALVLHLPYNDLSNGYHRDIPLSR